MDPAILVVSFGGPEKTEDVIPFLENVLRSRNVPRERMLEVAEHYYRFGGRSPINDQNRALVDALRKELRLPVYWGNRNWHPMLADTLRQMAADGVRNAFAFVTSAWASYSGCRQYLEDIARARAAVGPHAPQVEKLRAFYNHPGFIEANADRLRTALRQLPEATVLFSAHSIPLAMARGSRYEAQLHEASRLVAGSAGAKRWHLVYQSRSGPPRQPWLEPDVNDFLREHRSGEVVIAPIGFVSDHMEVVYDLDTEAARTCQELGIRMVRAGTAGVHPRFIEMVRELIEERLAGAPAAACPDDCCVAIC
ncbi:MAG: ferrochelatase [Bryobacteraceae bacterium]